MIRRIERLKRKKRIAWFAASLGVIVLVITALVWNHYHSRDVGERVGTASKTSKTKPVSLVVQVLDPAGKPAKNAKTSLFVDKKWFVQHSNAKGISRFAALNPGEGKLVVEVAGMARKTARVKFPRPENHLRVSLVEGVTLHGSVVDDQGAVIAKALVTLRLEKAEDIEPWSVESDEKGMFSLSTLVSGTYVLDIDAKTHERSVRRKLQIPRQEALRVVLMRAASLSGQVIGTDGSPAKGATVLIAGSGIWPARKVKSGDGGRFEIISLPSGVYEVRASLDNSVSKPKQGLELDPGSSDSLTLKLVPGVSLKGRVYDAVNDKPLSKAEVTVGEDSLCFVPVAVRTNNRGEFSVPGLLDKPHRVSIRSFGYVPVINQIRSAGPEQYAFPMRRAAVVAGRVVDSRGNPIAQATIELTGTSKTGEPITMRSEELRFRSSLFESQLRGPLPLTDSKGQTSLGNLGVTPGVVPTIPSQVSRPSTTSKKKDGNSSGFVTDKQGRFRIQGVPPGTIQVVARHRDYATKTGKAFSVVSGSVTDDVTIVLSEGGTIEGRVVDNEGAPVGRVRLEMSVEGDPFPRTTVSSEDGSFGFTNVLGPVDITASPIGRPTAHSELVVQPKKLHRVEIKVLTGSSKLEGRVLDKSGFPISGAIVRVESVNSHSRFDVTELSESDGSFTLAGLPKPPYRVSASHYDYAESNPIEVPTSHRRVVITLDTGVTIRGKVIDEWNQKPIRGATVELDNTAGSKPKRTKTTNKGEFQFRSVTGSKYYIIANSKGYVSARIELDISNYGRRDRVVETEEIQLVPGGSVSGEVVDNRGDVVHNAEVAVGSPPVWKTAVRTDVKGYFQIDGLPPGSVTLSARHKNAGEAESLRAVRIFPLQETPGILIRLPGRDTN